MAKPRVTVTDRLADVIEVVELGRRTGLLMVERGAGEMLEEGSIYFYRGRAAYAFVERVFGQDALAVLAGWGSCRFSFDPDAQRPAPNLAPPQPARPDLAGEGSWSVSSAGYYSAPSQVAQRGGATPPNWSSPTSQPPAPGSAPLSQPGVQQSPQLDASWPNSWPGATGAQAARPSSGSLPTPQGWPQPNAPITGPVGPAEPLARPPAAPFPPITYPTSGPAGAPAPQRPPARAEAALLRRPRRAPTVRDLLAVVQTYRLSRAHRTLLMLADGEHNVIDLARLSSKQIEEVLTLLHDLEGHGLVYYY